MDTAIANRRYRLGLRLFTSVVHWLRYWLVFGSLGALTASVVFADAFELGVWTPTVSVLQWFVGISAAVWLSQLLPVHLAAGVTRREFTVAFLVFGALATAATALLATAGFAAEHALLQLVAEPANTWGEALGSGVRYLVVTPIYFFAGAAVSALAMRIGYSAVMVAVMLVAVAAVYVGALTVEFFELRVDAAEWLAAWAGGALALIGVLVATCVLSLRSVPIRSKRV